MSKRVSSTYRLQLHAGFTYENAAAISDYLCSLGISHVYSSPCLQSAPGSTHGYDVTDFHAVNQELGGEAGREEFQRIMKACGLGMVLDIVPNHMSLAQNNPYWRDVLENGPESRYADYFDMDWITGEERMRNKVLLPLLASQYGVVLKSGAIRLIRTATRFEVALNGANLPVTPASMSTVLRRAAETLSSETLAFLADSLALLSTESTGTPSERERVRRNRDVSLTLLTRFLAERPEAIAAVDEAIAEVNADVDILDEFLNQQYYRLAYWKAANQDLGYRRFFDVNSLIGLRVDREEVFADTHELILKWLKSNAIDGVRIDHTDGLRDPQQYFERLRAKAPNAWIVTEKILARNESLREEWPVEGTTGYDFLNMANGLFVSAAGLPELDEIYHRALGGPVDYPRLVHDSKIAIINEILGSDVNWLTSLFVDICELDRDHRDHTRAEIREAIGEVAACFSVYRTYVFPERNDLTELDAAIIHNAVEVATSYRPEIDRDLFTFLEDVLLLRRQGALETDFLLRFQQFTGPVMAKGFEDTTLYRYNRLIGVNEVGGNPFNPAVSVEEFHRFNEQAQKSHPEGMVTLATHDTKRGEDTRARLVAISETPAIFGELMERCFAMNAPLRRDGWPDPNTEFLYYQTLIGSWPISLERLLLYMEKATREAKQQTSWTRNNRAFEKQLKEFIRRTLDNKAFVSAIEGFIRIVDEPGRRNSLAQTLLKCTVPGVPDIYQGSELWDHRLVDPDNRGPVNFEERERLLKEMHSLKAGDMLQHMSKGMPKLWTIVRALRVRSAYPECFGRTGSYTPLLADGERSSHVVAFLRGDRVAAIVPRLTMEFGDKWDGTTLKLPSGRWTNVLDDRQLDGGVIEIKTLLSQFPVALLTRKD